jgi:hypothetical protein
MVNLRTGHAVVYQPTAANALREAVWTLYKLAGKGTWKPIKPFVDQYRNESYIETAEAFANAINGAANAQYVAEEAKPKADPVGVCRRTRSAESRNQYRGVRPQAGRDRRPDRVGRLNGRTGRRAECRGGSAHGTAGQGGAAGQVARA